MLQQAYTTTGTATIANNGTDSSAINYKGYRSGILILPAAFTGASISFKISVDGSTWAALYNDSNTLISITIGTGRAYRIPVEALGAAYVQIVSASAEGAARSLVFMLKS